MNYPGIMAKSGERDQWLRALPERLLALPENKLTPRFSLPGSLLLLALWTLLSLAVACGVFFNMLHADMAAQAGQRAARVDEFMRVALNDLDRVSVSVSDTCDGVTAEELMRASISSVVVSRFHWLPNRQAQVCTPFQSIGDPVSEMLRQTIAAGADTQPDINFMRTPTADADILVVRRVGEHGYLAGQLPGSLVNDYLNANGADDLARVQMRRLDGLVLRDTSGQTARPVTGSGQTAGMLTRSVDSKVQPLTVQVWADPRALFSRILRYLLSGLMLSLLLTAFTISQINIALQQRSSLEKRLRIGLRKRQFEPAIQPIVDAQTGRCLGGEVLMRWRHPARGLLSPFEFLAVAEETGLIDEMTALIMTKARDRLSGILLSHPDLYFSFNVTVGQLRNPKFADWLDRVFDLHSVPSTNVVIELVERDAVDTQTRETLTELRRRGYRIAIDDFGTGQSSLALLPTISFDCLKIDREFVRSIDEESVNRPVLTAIIALARQLGVASIAEGVETPAQHEFLIGEGVDAVQGYLIAKPMPVTEFTQWLYAYAHHPGYAKPAGKSASPPRHSASTTARARQVPEPGSQAQTDTPSPAASLLEV